MIKPLLCLLLSLCCITTVSAQGFKIELTEQDIQSYLDANEAVHIQHPFYKLTLIGATIDLLPETNNALFSSNLRAEIPGVIAGTGKAGIVGNIGYRKDKGEFYLLNAQLKELTIDQLSENMQAQIKQIIQQALSSQFKSIKLYRLNDQDAKQKMALSALQSVDIVGEKVVFSLNPL